MTMTRIGSIVTCTALVLLGAAGRAQAFNFGTLTYNANVQSLVNGIDQPTLQQSIAELSGETQAVVGGVATYLPTRSAKDPLVARVEQYLYEHLQSYGLNPVYQTYPGTGVVPSHRNVIAEIKGTTNPSQVVIIAAHLDDRPWSGSLAYGSDDDATGCATLLYIARTFAGKTFDRTIRFAFFNAEEDAPWSGSGKNFGSGYYAAGLRAANENVVAMIAADSFAWNLSNNGITYMVTRKANFDTGGGDAAIFNAWKQVFPLYGITGITPLQQASGDNLDDHGSFWANAYNAVMFIEDDVSQVNPNWEQLTDRVTTAGWQWPYLVQNAKSLVAVSAHLGGMH